MRKGNVGFLKSQEILKSLSDCHVSKVGPFLGKEFSCKLYGYSFSEGIIIIVL
jgi:hypothetical protein